MRRQGFAARAKRLLAWGFGLGLALAGYAAFRLSPWPAALLVRHAFDQESARMSAALAKHVPPGVAAQRDLPYAPGDRDARLDVYRPAPLAAGRALPAVVWVHGGGWVSGNKNDVANYARILAARGYAVVAVNYSIAPGATYPTPLRQLAAALRYLDREAPRLRIDRTRLFLAGDSAGAQIVAQMANIVASPAYAARVGIGAPLARAQLRGVLLYCGAYDVTMANSDGPYAGLLETLLWSYSGRKDFLRDPGIAAAAVIRYVTPDFPPAFVSAGNADPLAPQSRAFAAALRRQGVAVDALFFPGHHVPALPHEYQFDLDTAAGRLALERSAAFLAQRR
ncbi:alpha/beta hydrolase [Vulcaniibacterium tengchongense]|uniref:Acetyl esterase/lipase n=1 Tax=Vulcaniibacterium tengchongense TaxID=1273429 RepID=A0A3N4VEC4_9GAMM|nr:alpha/beta hydrolase [Vulcaniibacterium tengchongense]RPE80153.1 acetyl esterase/lipase [Vulcaniibacterium tengchongense]